jgi:hypothetical protein
MVVATPQPGQIALTDSAERQPGKVVHLDQTLEQKLTCALAYIEQLQHEIRSLRTDLIRSERLAAQREVLLRNALNREQELRTELLRMIL